MKNAKTVLLIEEDAATRADLRLLLTGMRHSIIECRTAADAGAQMGRQEIHLAIGTAAAFSAHDYQLLHALRAQAPAMPCIALTGFKEVPEAVRAIKAGVDDYLVKPLQNDTVIEMVSRLLGCAVKVTQMIAADPRSQHIVDLARRVADSSATVMISGESGSGKEVFARYIHEQSPRADKPFVAINCAAIPETMLESILFGHEKGTFTGAVASRAGKFEQANGGTLLLDEISEMDLGLQAKLLRVIQEKEVERLGSNKTVSLDVRLLATTNRNLKMEVAAGRFREDLFYRLNVFPLNLPPLRERPGDIVPLAQRFIEQFEPGKQIELASDAAALLQRHTWPGNVRELENVIQRALILCKDGVITANDLIFELDTPSSAAPAYAMPPSSTMPTYGAQHAPGPLAYSMQSPSAVAFQALAGPAASAAPNLLESDLRTREKEIIIEAVRNNASRKQAAEKLGISPRTLRYKMARFRKQEMTAVLPA
ncbi:MAG: sigma-54-dependent transcriptional regulator [Gammaproteobacteria bacterium]